MLDQTDSRQSIRLVEAAEISSKFPDPEQSYIGVCLNISGSLLEQCPQPTPVK